MLLKDALSDAEWTQHTYESQTCVWFMQISIDYNKFAQLLYQHSNQFYRRQQKLILFRKQSNINTNINFLHSYPTIHAQNIGMCDWAYHTIVNDSVKATLSNKNMGIRIMHTHTQLLYYMSQKKHT